MNNVRDAGFSRKRGGNAGSRPPLLDPGLTDGNFGWRRFFRWELISVVSSVVRRGQEMFCGCGRFRFVVRVIYGTAVFFKSVF